ncbi:sodium:proton antiporter [Fodinibius sp. Rm-B-1B1-1]|uniref:cation:proton antiporter n=1 Tax=Fodinibius alkaliphilus TaxID=3140241 RepID=UPI00315ACFC2
MGGHLLIGITSILIFGIGAQWVAWRFKLPAILLLLISGIIAGPVFGLLDPDQLMGELLAPFISVSVAIILFEGGLSLRFSELENIGGVIGNLVSIGVIITWIITALSAHYLFPFGWELSILLGAILVVTGPTVIIPLLRQVRPSGQVGSILKWEGIIIDPIGAMLAVLVFEVILSTSLSAATNVAFMSIVKTILFGTLVGLAGAALIYFLLKRHLLPDFLQNPINLMVVVTVFTVSNMLQHESGLWAATLMGIALANQKTARIHHITEFKENLRVLLLSSLFILLAARVELDNLIENLNWNVAAFLAILILVARPIGVYISTMFSDINWREKLFLCWMAPRGVVAASISSIFAISLAQNGFSHADQLVPIVFLVIIGTVTIYGLPASWVARKLGVAKPIPNGVLILGANNFALKVAEIIKKEGLKVLVADSNWRNIAKAKSKGLDTYHGNILSEFALEELNLDGIGRLISLTPNDETNSLAALRFGEIFGRSHVFQISPNTQGYLESKQDSSLSIGRVLFHKKLNFELISKLVRSNTEIKVKAFNEKNESIDDIEEEIIPLFLITTNHEIQLFTVDQTPSPADGDKIFYISIDQKMREELEKVEIADDST